MKRPQIRLALSLIAVSLHLQNPCLASGRISDTDFTGLGLALAYHARSEMTLAAEEFKAEAQLGSAAAQRNLGLMLAKGQGVERDISAAYLWLKSAAHQGDPQAQNIAEIAYEQMSAQEQAETDRQLDSFVSSHARQSVIESLLPALDHDQTSHRQLYKIPNPGGTRVPPRYPAELIRSGVFGSVLVGMTITTQGIPRNPSMVMATDTRFFKEAAKVLPRWRLPPLSSSVHARQLFYFMLGGQSTTARESERVLASYKAKADGGSAVDLTLYALLIRSLPEGGPLQQPVKSTKLMADAAMQGVPLARHLLADALEFGYGCERELEKANAWRRIAANHGVPAARYRMAERASNSTEQLFWLKSAAAVDSAEATVHLAWLQTTLPSAEFHDPISAVDMLDAVENAYGDRIAWLEARAAASAAIGDFQSAKDMQKTALKYRKRFRWPKEAANEFMSKYKQGQALALNNIRPPWLVDEPGLLIQ